MKQFVLAAGALVLAVVAACSSADTGSNGGASGCNSNPFACPIGTTCWETDAKTFKCIVSGSGKEGDTCQNFYGQPTCNDGLFCFNAQGAMSGVCTPFCDPKNPAHACLGNAACGTAYFPGGPGISVCAPQAKMDGGADAAHDTGADAPAEAAPDASVDAADQ